MKVKLLMNSLFNLPQNQLTVNIADRDELQKKLHKYKEQVLIDNVALVNVCTTCFGITTVCHCN